MYRFITEMYYENLGGTNSFEKIEDFDEYRDYLFNDDVNYIILDYLNEYHFEHEKEVRDYILNFIIDYRRPEILDGVTMGDSYTDYLKSVETIINRLYKYDIENQLKGNEYVDIEDKLAELDRKYGHTAIPEIARYRTDISIDSVVELISENRTNVPRKHMWDWARDNSYRLTELINALGFSYFHEEVETAIEEGEKRKIKKFISDNFMDFVLYGVYTQLIELGTTGITEKAEQQFKAMALGSSLDWSIDKILHTIL